MEVFVVSAFADPIPTPADLTPTPPDRLSTCSSCTKEKMEAMSSTPEFSATSTADQKITGLELLQQSC
jgi:hypothetical protein